MLIALYRCREFYSKFYGLFLIYSPRWGLVIHPPHCVARDTEVQWGRWCCAAPLPLLGQWWLGFPPLFSHKFVGVISPTVSQRGALYSTMARNYCTCSPMCTYPSPGKYEQRGNYRARNRPIWTRSHPGPPRLIVAVAGSQLAGALAQQHLPKTSALNGAKGAYFIPGHTVGEGVLSLPLGTQEMSRRQGHSFTFASALSATVVVVPSDGDESTFCFAW